MITEHEFEGACGDNLWFNAKVEVTWEAYDEGIGYYEYGEGVYNDVQYAWSFEDWGCVSFEIYDEEGESIFKCDDVKSDTKYPYLKDIEPLLDRLTEDVDFPDDDPTYTTEEYEYYDPDDRTE